MTQVASDRMAREIEHFDRHYAAEASRGIKPLSTFDRFRYTNPGANTIYPREHFYHLLGPLDGRDVLEIACGNGVDASLCAFNGANVFAYDLSAEAVAMTRRRAEINGVADRVLVQRTGEIDLAFPGRQFDRIIGYATLHHLPMDGLAARIGARLRPGGVAVFAEPVVNSRTLLALRRCIPVKFAEDTDDETPLSDALIAQFARPFDSFQRREFQCVSRIWPWFASRWSLVRAVHGLDYLLMKLPMLRRFATVVVFAVGRDAETVTLPYPQADAPLRRAA